MIVKSFVFAALAAAFFASCDKPRVVEGGENAGKEEKLSLYFFYEELCASCDGAPESVRAQFNAIAQTELADVRDIYPYEIYEVNVYKESGREIFEREAAGLGAKDEDLPVLAAGGKALKGLPDIQRNIKEFFLTAGEDLFVYKTPYDPGAKKTGGRLFEDTPFDKDAVTLVYFYRTVCDECNAVKPFVEAFPPTVREGGAAKPLNVLRFNTRSGNNGERIAAFFDYYAVPDAERQVPIVFTAAGYFSGGKSIEEGLQIIPFQTGFPLLEEYNAFEE